MVPFHQVCPRRRNRYYEREVGTKRLFGGIWGLLGIGHWNSCIVLDRDYELDTTGLLMGKVDVVVVWCVLLIFHLLSTPLADGLTCCKRRRKGIVRSVSRRIHPFLYNAIVGLNSIGHSQLKDFEDTEALQ